MARIDDVLLNAYIDGELGHEDVTEVTLALRDDPEATRRLACFQRLDALIHQAYNPILDAFRSWFGFIRTYSNGSGSFQRKFCTRL